MIGRLFSTLRAPPPGEDTPQDAVLAAPPEETARFAPMVPLMPPSAVNDDPEGALCDAVEAALRDAGYLPEPPAA
ncbi:hypothetical protein NS228_18230 [Methylobacterium indicum]|uniref:hypothetical protein n=1 Tax=Methylobacterium indicum TaxID=1775910 RepID=UPI000652A5FF|nr:hypothetical protein [Methylobacterium indicum]KMO23836.1 hypothetical protein QR78_02800 [Methylobacterium indicum]KTS38042.1 hypothetical protein NS228_18230 [Methylobacterium indicum]KTS53293.1 hypothetical protein NS230_06600 [Methylobacterium indicum]